jgi:Protein phosphatase 2C
MQTVFATDPGSPDRANEDYAVCGPDWAVILDGATAPAGVDSGCIHDVPWLVRHLAAGIVQGLALEDVPLPDVLAEAIRTTCKAHESTCDLSNPDSPSSTAAIVRTRGDALDYLVLGDSDVILRCGRDILPVHDDRTEHLPGGRPYSFELVRQCRNAPGGFWIASTRPDAAYEAISGSAGGVSDAALLTDGVARLRDWYGWDWRDLLDALRYRGGPAELIRRVRAAERTAGVPFGKTHDDATVIFASSVLQPAAAPVIPDPLVMVR